MIRTVLKQGPYLVKRTYVELDAISDNLENAVIATEDRSFIKLRDKLSTNHLSCFDLGASQVVVQRLPNS